MPLRFRVRRALLFGLPLIAACGQLEIGSYGEGADTGDIATPPPTTVASDDAGTGSSSRGSAGAEAGGAGSAGGAEAEGQGGAGEAEAGASGSTAGETGSPTGGVLVSADVGNTTEPGRVVSNEGIHVIEASGADIEDSSDSFHFLHESLTGDGQIVARIEDVTPTNAWTKVGVMVRDSLAANAKNVFMLLRPSQGSAFQYRPANSANTVSTWQEVPPDFTPEHNVRYLRPPKWLKLTREGDVLTAYSSDDGKCWWRRWTQALAFDDAKVLFGVALSSGAYGDRAAARVTNVAVDSVIEPHNAGCERAQTDGDLRVPPAEYWLVRPARFGGSGWDYTTLNPNGTVEGSKCDPYAPDDAASFAIAARSDGPDHPNCPDREASPAWTQLQFEPDASWELDQDSGIGFAALQASDVLSTFVDARGIWLRKVFTVTSHTQKNDLMLWGRFSDGITVYVNGVLATWNSAGTGEYKYLGLSDEARAALVVGGDNVIAVRLEWDRYFWNDGHVVEGDAGDRFFDMGLTTESRLAHVPLQRMLEPNAGIAAYVDSVKEFMQEQAISGATLAISKDGELVASAGLGWRDKNLDVPMARGARLRLGGNDEIITQAAIAKLVNDGVIDASTPVFPLLDLEPIPGHSPGAGVDLITVEHLRTHTSGIAATEHYQSILDELAFDFGISPDQWTSEHTARWLYSLDATNVGTSGGSSRDAYFLLRYLAERLIAPKTLEEYLAEDMGLSGVALSHERLTGREPNEGYITREPTWDRWLALENYLAFSASAEGYASFFDDFALSYELTPQGFYKAADGGGVIAGMPGTWSVALVDPTRALSFVIVANNHGHFDEVIERVNRITNDGSPCLFGAEDPRDRLGLFHFIQNREQPDRYINLESGLAASPAVAGWWSARWLLEPTGDGYFRLKNRWTEQYLLVDGGQLQVGAAIASSANAEWALVPSADAFRIQNRAVSQVLVLEDGLQLSSSSGASADWKFCD